MLISVSDLKLHTSCPQKFHNAYISRRGKEFRSDALDVGLMVHRYFELAIGGALHQSAFDEAPQACPIQDDETFFKALSTFASLSPTLEAWKPPVEWSVRSVEEELRYPLGDHILVGRLDTVVDWNDMLWHLQHKTLSSTTPTAVFSEMMRTDWHECVYHRMMEVKYPNERIGGTILNLIRKLSKKALESDGPESAIEFHYLARSSEIVERAIEDITQRMVDIEHELAGIRTIERRRTSCGGDFRNRLCQYKDVCDGLIQLDNPRFVDLTPRYTENE